MRLQQRILVIILPLILIPTILLGWFAYTYGNSIKNTLDKALLDHTVAFKVYELDHALSDLVKQAHHLSFNSAIKQAFKSQQDFAALQMSLANFQKLNTHTQLIALLNEDGQLFAQGQTR